MRKSGFNRNIAPECPENQRGTLTLYNGIHHKSLPPNLSVALKFLRPSLSSTKISLVLRFQNSLGGLFVIESGIRDQVTIRDACVTEMREDATPLSA